MSFTNEELKTIVTDFNNIVDREEKKSTPFNSKIMAAVIIVIIIAVVAYYYFQKKKKKDGSAVEAVQSANTDTGDII